MTVREPLALRDFWTPTLVPPGFPAGLVEDSWTPTLPARALASSRRRFGRFGDTHIVLPANIYAGTHIGIGVMGVHISTRRFPDGFVDTHFRSTTPGGT